MPPRPTIARSSRCLGTAQRATSQFRFRAGPQPIAGRFITKPARPLVSEGHDRDLNDTEASRAITGRRQRDAETPPAGFPVAWRAMRSGEGDDGRAPYGANWGT